MNFGGADDLFNALIKYKTVVVLEVEHLLDFGYPSLISAVFFRPWMYNWHSESVYQLLDGYNGRPDSRDHNICRWWRREVYLSS